MAGPTFAASAEIIAEPDQVWAVLADIDRSPRVLTSVTAVERIDGPPFDVGTRWKETRLIPGGKATEELTITAIVPGRSVTFEADLAGTRLKVVYYVKPSSLGTRLEAECFLDNPGSGLGRLFGANTRVGRTARDVLEQDLRDIGAALRR
jgi:carbon monoxide dehydrogenase subunit G